MPSQCFISARAVSLAAFTLVLVACSDSVAPSAAPTTPSSPATAILSTHNGIALDAALDDAVERVAPTLGDGPEAVAVRASLVAVRMASASDRGVAIDRARLALMRMPNDAAAAPERDVLVLTVDAIAK
jgi:hypothetical protein